MLDISKLDRSIIFDIETVSIAPNYEALKKDFPLLYKSFDYYCKYTNKSETLTCSEYFEQVGMLEPEYGKIVCFSFGKLIYKGEDYKFEIKSYYGKDEKKTLKKIANLLNQAKSNNFNLAGHNIKSFDIPFLIKRFILNGMPVPDILWLFDKKPWETPFIDTKEVWKFGSWNQNISMVEMAIMLGLQSPKDIMDGSEVKKEYWINEDLEKIKTYCEGDVLATGEILIRLTDWFYQINKS